MSEQTVAYRYAKPLLELAQDKGVLEAVHQDMMFLKEACEANKQLIAVLRNPVIRGYKKFGVLKALFATRVNPMTLAMIEILTRKHRENILYEISIEFGKIYHRLQNIQEVTLTATQAFTELQKDELIGKLEAQLGQKVVLKEKLNTALLGGFVLQIGNSQIDSSVRTALNRLKKKFSEQI